MAEPKLFISYSWTTPDHEARVLQLAVELRESGVDVILDKWDLREGHDSYAFMEKMVTDPDIRKVLLVCDKGYAEKADGRKGGVGAEAQIISPDIYASQDQDKFVAVILERDEEGRPYVPAYYRSRIYIDLSDPSCYSSNFEQLIRWAHDQPLYKKPPLGKKPFFLSDDNRNINLATSSRHRRALDSVRNQHRLSKPAVAEYFSLLAEEFERLRLSPDAEPFDEAVVQSIDSFVPYRDQAIELFMTMALYQDELDAAELLHTFFEALIPYLDKPQGMMQWREGDFDNFRFIIHELFLYASASLIRHEKFAAASYLMRADYYIPENLRVGHDDLVSFEIFVRARLRLQEEIPGLESGACP